MAYFIDLTLRHNGRRMWFRKSSIKRVTPKSEGCEILQDGAPSPIEVAEDIDAIMLELETPDE